MVLRGGGDSPATLSLYAEAFADLDSTTTTTTSADEKMGELSFSSAPTPLNVLSISGSTGVTLERAPASPAPTNCTNAAGCS